MMGWPKAQLADLCEVFTDGDWIESKSQSPEGVRLIQTGNIGEGKFKNRRDKSRFISEETFDDLKCCEIFEGDCLVSRLPDPVGRSCILPKSEDRMITAVDCTILRFKKDKLISEFFNYFSQSSIYLNKVESLTSGATRKRISRKNLGLVDIPTPPIPEQKRIVTILDQAFADIEQARAKTEQNLKNARELFESYLQQVSGEKKPLGEFVNIKTGKLNSNAAVEGGEYPFFTCSRDIFAINQFSFDCEAILLAGNNASGDFNVKHYKGKFDAYQRTYVITINDENTLLYHFLYYQMLKSLKELKVSSVGAGTKFLKLGMIKDLKISIPPINTQREILETLLVLKDDVDKLENIYKTKIASLDEIKKSILQKAFSGELTKTLEVDTNKGAVA